jgi:hypothetical protein
MQVAKGLSPFMMTEVYRDHLAKENCMADGLPTVDLLNFAPGSDAALRAVHLYCKDLPNVQRRPTLHRPQERMN